MPEKFTKKDEKVIIRYKSGESVRTFQEAARYCFGLFVAGEMKEKTTSKSERADGNVCSGQQLGEDL